MKYQVQNKGGRFITGAQCNQDKFFAAEEVYPIDIALLMGARLLTSLPQNLFPLFW
jgi:hypothetical protein